MPGFTFAQGVPPVGVGMIADHQNLLKGEPNQILSALGNNTITSAQLLTLGAAPVQLVPPPVVQGSGSPIPGVAYILQGAAFKINPGTTAFTSTGATLGIAYGPTGVAQIAIPAAFLAFTVPTDLVNVVPAGAYQAASSVIEGAGLYLVNPGTALAAGNGTLDVILNYLIVQM